MANSGSGQNMLATRVYFTGGEYFLIDGKRVITIAPKATVGIVFDAYCADFDKDNPTKDENLSFRVVPQAKIKIASQISRYSAANITVDLTIPIQLAVWRDEGKSREEIARKFNFTSIEWELSTKILSF